MNPHLRIKLFLAEAQHYEVMAEIYSQRHFSGSPTIRDAYRDMASALRLLADERGT